MAVYKDKDELMSKDWQGEINKAVSEGRMQDAAQYEQARNEKINSSDYKGGQKATNLYSQYLGTGIDYSGTNYHQDAIDAAKDGNLDAARNYLYDRDAKTLATGMNTDQSGEDIYTALLAQFGGKETDYGGFSYENAPSYYDKYSARTDALLNEVLNRQPFSYNAETDPLYQQYKEQYTREGERAMQDTIGQVSARTGGLASSYATTAAQQANDYYMQQLTDKIPELTQLAYSMYLDDLNAKRQDLSLLQSMSDSEYAKYRDEMGDWYNNRDFSYGLYRDDIADQRYQTEWDYNVGRDQIADQRYDTEWEYQLGRDQIADQRYDSEWEYQKSRDAVADDQWLKSYNASLRSSGGGGGGGNGGSDGEEDPIIAALADISGYDYNTILAMKNSGSPKYTEMLQQTGLGGTAGPKPGAAGQNLLTVDNYNFTTQAAAENFLKSRVPSGATGMMSENEWNQKRSAFMAYGVGVDEVRLNRTYSEYLNDFVKYKLASGGK